MFTPSERTRTLTRHHDHIGRRGLTCAAVAGAIVVGSLHFAPDANAATSIPIPKSCTAVSGMKSVSVPAGWRTSVVKEAFKYCGDRYVFGAASASGKGVDCSGLIMLAYKPAGNPFKTHKANIEIRTKGLATRGAGNLAKAAGGNPVAGDLVGISSNSGGFYHHIGIYLGVDPKTKARVYINAPHTGDHVRVSKVPTGEYEVYKNPDKIVKS